MGVFCTDRLTGAGFGVSNRLWVLLGQSLAALGAARVSEAFVRDGYVPSWLARSWSQLLFDDVGDLVVVARPVAGRPGELRPVALYRSGSPAGLSYARAGEQLSVYDLPLATVLLRFAQFCGSGGGHSTTTLRPPAPGTAVGEVAARVWQVRSGLYPARPHRPARPSLRRETRTA